MNRAVFVRAVPRGLRGAPSHIYSVVKPGYVGKREEAAPERGPPSLLGTGVLLLCNQFFLGKRRDGHFRSWCPPLL